MDNDDVLVGRLLSRREVLGLLGIGSLALVVGCSTDKSTATPTSGSTPAGGAASPTRAGVSATAANTTSALPFCVATPELTEGPYFVDEKLERSDIRSDPSNGSVKDGVPLTLNFVVSSVGANGCAPLTGASVDVWHCDALGVYSDVQDPGFSTNGQKFPRGYQRTDLAGKASFATIYPGWYQGRAVHIHFKIRSDASRGKAYEFTSQLFFDDGLNDKVFAQPPYTQKSGQPLRNSADQIFRGGSDQLLLQPVQQGNGYAATFDVGLRIA